MLGSSRHGDINSPDIELPDIDIGLPDIDVPWRLDPHHHDSPAASGRPAVHNRGPAGTAVAGGTHGDGDHR